MVVAFVLIQVEVGKAPQLVKKVKTFPGVTEAYLVAGPYDVLVKLEADKFEKVAQTVTEHLHGLEGVKSTLTLFAFE